MSIQSYDNLDNNKNKFVRYRAISLSVENVFNTFVFHNNEI